MFSSFSQHQNNLLTSQRFYYNNYEYYNDYQKIQTKYKDDLSKVYFRLNRKTKGTIFYQWNSLINNRNDYHHDKSSLMEAESKSSQHHPKHQQPFKTAYSKGIENLLFTVLQTFHEQNYSDIRLDLDSKKQLYQFVNLKNVSILNRYFNPPIEHQSLTPYEENSIDVLNEILKKESSEQEFYYEAIEKMNCFAKEEDHVFLERWNAFENFGFYHLDHQLVKKDNSKTYKEELKKLYRFCVKVRFVLERTLAASYFNSLLIHLPNLKKTSRIFHPLTMGISYANKFFEEKNGFKKKPRIVFLNLDGRQTPYNLRYARNIGQNLLYITVYKQPSHHYKKNQKMEYEFESDYDTTFSNISQCYSRMLINEAYPQPELFTNNSEEKFTNKSKMLLFPLESEYLRKQFYRSERQKSSNPPKTFPKLETSHDIYFLFQTVIFEEIRSFDPTFVFVSYNGFLGLSDEHWNEIVKNLTIIADHKVSLFVDFIDKLGKKNMGGDDEEQEEQQEQQQENFSQSQGQQQEQLEQQEDDMDDLKVRNIQVVQQFISKYIPFRRFWPHIDHERTINSIVMFLKISSGVYSMQPKLMLSHHLKFSLGHRYGYLERLCKSKELMETMQKYVPKVLKSQEIEQLYGNQAKIELKENRKQNQTYEKLIDSVILQFLPDIHTPRQRFHSNPKLCYRLQQILQEQQSQNLLHYGTQQDQNPEYNSSFSPSTLHQHRHSNAIPDYLKEMKRKLLLQNLETYKHKKIFYHEEDSEATHQSLSPAQKIKCFKFYLYEDDAEQISFEKYTQVIFDSKKSRVYIINYKANDQRHLILYGHMASTIYEKKHSIKVQIAKESQHELQNPIYSLFEKNSGQSMQFSNDEQQINLLRKDLIFVNYSHCFVKNKLYLFWPQKWSIRDEIRHKLLNLRYKPENVNLMIRVQYNNDYQCVYETLKLQENEKIYIQPRIGCSSYEIQCQDDEFFIFGGIQDNENDFIDIGEGIYHAQVKEGSNQFVVRPLPKIKEKSVSKSQISMISNSKKSNSFAIRLKPKMHYRIQKFVQNGSNNEQGKLIISGGYGREYTNFFNFFSFDSYLFNTNTRQIEAKELHPRRLIKLPRPIQINRLGKFYMISNNQNIQEVQQNFSDLPKDFFAFQFKGQKSFQLNMQTGPIQQNRPNMMNTEQSSNMVSTQNSIIKHSQNREVHSFIDQRYRSSEFKFDGKKIYLCGFNRTIREKIYSKFWSPQLYILDGNQSSIVHISLKTEKSYSYNISNFLMPRQEDIVSLCLDEDKLYVLSSSPVIHSIQHTNSKYVLYEGNLSNMNDVLHKHEIQMYEKFDFKRQKDHMLKYKTIYAFDDKIYLFGGLATNQEPSVLTLTSEQGMDVEGRGKVSYREDYILEKEKNKFVLKTRKVESFKDSVEMLSPAIVKFNQLLYFYSIEMTETVVKKPNCPFPQIKENYRIKIEEFDSQSSSQGRCMSQIMKFYAWDGTNGKIQRIIPRLNDAKFVSIAKHQAFNLSKFKQHLEKVAIRLRKFIDEKTIVDQKTSDFYSKCLILLKQKNEELVIITLQREDKFFKDLISSIRPDINERDRNIEEEELIKDLKICYSLVNKLILESLIEKAHEEESNRQETSSIADSMHESAMEGQSISSNQNIKKQRLVEKLQKMTLNTQESSTQYRFIVEDSKSSRKIRYIAIGPLVNVQELRFFRIRFRHDVSLCLNKTNQDGFYYHPTVNSCQEIDLNDKFAQYDIMSEEDIRNQTKSYKEYMLYCQLKLQDRN